MPVLWPRPNWAAYSSSLSMPTRRATSQKYTLQESLMAFTRFSVPWPERLWQYVRKFRQPSTVYRPPQ